MADDYLRRTAITRPILTDEQKHLLTATINEWGRLQRQQPDRMGTR